MRPFYEAKQNNLEIYEKRSVHVSPHIHKSLECVYVTQGTLELGIGETLYHMDQHDFALVFPNMIHHYQVFGGPACHAIYLLTSPELTGTFSESLQTFYPENPVIVSCNVHPDIPYALHALEMLPLDCYQTTLSQSYTQIILARSFGILHLLNRSDAPAHDIVYNVVTYMARHFTEDISLTKMSHDLGVNLYTLSRVFSSTFHMNFNQYLNQLRLDCAAEFFQNTSESITDIALNSGFTSQSTFNRVFRERFHMSPREYRKRLQSSMQSPHPRPALQSEN